MKRVLVFAGFLLLLSVCSVNDSKAGIYYWWIDPFYTPSSPKFEPDGVLVQEVDELDIKPYVTSWIDETLNHLDGWGAAGIEFKQIEDANRAHILFYPMDKNKIAEACGNEYEGEGKSGCAIVNEYQCRIPVQAPVGLSFALVPEGQALVMTDLAFLITINHEVGHCFGIDHSPIENDLMYFKGNSDTNLYPNVYDIQKVKNWLEDNK